MAALATGLQKLPAEVDTISIADAEALFVYWERCPPPAAGIAILARALTTWKPPDRPWRGETKESTPEDLMSFAAEFGLPVQQR